MISRPPAQPPAPAPAPPMRPGANVLMGRNPLGFWVEGPRGGAVFSHPFTVMVSGEMARVSKGLLIAKISVEPVIGKVPIGGDDKNPQPEIKLNAGLVDDLGQSWICVEVTPDKDGKLDAKAKKPQVVAVQRNHPIALTGETGRKPLALLLRKNDRWQVFQIAMFHLSYVTSQPAKGPRQHFFL